ncbi:MAG: alpha/beta hydrolase family protein [Actinomycetota bacterium]
MSFVDRLARIPSRSAFAFTPDGRRVTYLTDRAGAVSVEAQDLQDSRNGSGPREVYRDDRALSIHSQLGFPSAERIQICCGEEEEGWFQLIEARRGGRGGGGTWTTRPVADCEAMMLSLVPPLEGADWDLAVSYADGVSTILRIEDGQPRLRPLARVPGILSVGGWLDPTRSLIANVTEAGGAASGYVIDLAGRTYHRLFHIADASNDRIVACDARRGLLWVASDCSGYHRVGVAALGDARLVRFFPDLPGEERSAVPCGRSGGQLVLRRQRGAVTELWLADPSSLAVTGPLRLPDGALGSSVVDAGDRVRFAFSTPTAPMSCASYLTARDLFRFEETPGTRDPLPGELVAPRLISFPGPRGDLETLVYEPSGCSRRDLVVVALHGGPVDQWSAGFTRELQLFAGLGAVVVAPNYHGSTGYGDAFLGTLEGAAGSVDLDDAVAVTTAMRQSAGGQAALVLYGQSYGAFLALMTAATRRKICDGVIALSPFTSLSSIRSAGTPSVRRLVDVLASPMRPEEESDLLRRCGDLDAKLLIAHGSRDRVIPIEQSQALCDRLRAHGHRDGRDLWFLPLPGEDHVITGRAGVLALYHQIESFVSDVASARKGSRTWQADGQSSAHPSLRSRAAPSREEVISQ